MVSFARDIRPLFRPKDINAMRNFGGFDLSKYDDVVANAGTIYERLRDGSMPCDAPWQPEFVDLFSRWRDENMPP